ncbi:hypothetical protein Nepgr_019710 [Nepenthes gracilis]|uniref:Uncharacterized protein n=1 Tax=Nepenthes gracilis TaxID=150966 RepID=A0AAD3SWC0_NEPGR|nr:hypothetical protein Nepgr_019710 [Nepenthes gracilis]
MNPSTDPIRRRARAGKPSESTPARRRKAKPTSLATVVATQRFESFKANMETFSGSKQVAALTRLKEKEEDGNGGRG